MGVEARLAAHASHIRRLQTMRRHALTRQKLNIETIQTKGLRREIILVVCRFCQVGRGWEGEGAKFALEVITTFRFVSAE